MRSSRWVSIGLWLALAPAAASASLKSRVTFLQTPSFSKWKIANAKALSARQLSGLGAIPAVDREYGATKAVLNTYARNGARIQAVIEQASDPSAAFGLLTFYQTEAMRPVPGVEFAVADTETALMARSDMFIRVLRNEREGVPESELRSFLLSIGGAKQPADAMDMMPASLPSRGMIPASEKYVLGPEAAARAIPWMPTALLDFPMGAEAHAATYERGGGTVALLLVSYPTAQIARARFRAIQNQLHLSRPGEEGQMYGRQDGGFVFLVDRAGKASPAQAIALMNDLTVKQSVTQGAEYPGKPVSVQLLQLILANIFLVLYLVGAAVAGGVLMVIGRRLISRWFPNSDWGHGGEGSLIQLHIEGR